MRANTPWPWALVGWTLAAVCWAQLGGCGSQLGGLAAIPPLTGNDRVELAQNASADALALRAAAELERGQPERAQRFVRWALALEPEHLGALVGAARIAKHTGALAVASRYYKLAASLDVRGADKVEAERVDLLVRYAQAELVAGRVEQTAALLDEIEEVATHGLGNERRAVAGLYGDLADTWLDRELSGPAKAAATRAQALGADGERSRLRLLLADVIAAGALPAGPDDSGLGPFQVRVQSELGRDVTRWVLVAQWARRTGRVATARWLAERATTLDAGRVDAWVALAEAHMLAIRDADAISALLRAAELVKPGEAAELLAEAAERAGRAAMGAIVPLARAAIERAPGSQAAVRAVRLAFETVLRMNGREAALALIETVIRATPRSWSSLIQPLAARDDHAGIAQVLGVAREAGLVDAVAHAIEVAQARGVRARPGDDAAFDAALAASPSFQVALELARLARNDAERSAKVRALGRASVNAYLDAMEVRGDLAKARAILQPARAGAAAVDGGFEQAFVQAHFELEGGEPARALGLAEEAARRAGPGEEAIAEGFALQLALSAGPSKAEGRARAWLAAPVDPAALDAHERGAILWRLLGAVSNAQDVLLLVQEALLAEPETRWLPAAYDAVRGARVVTLGRLGRWEERDDAWVESLTPPASAGAVAGAEPSARPGAVRAAINEALPRIPPEQLDRMLRLAARLHPAEHLRRDGMADMYKLLASRDERYRARRVVEHILSLGDGDGLGRSRLIVLAQELLDYDEASLAVRVNVRLYETGERSPRASQGWVRALLRAGDLAQADAVAARALESAPKRDLRPAEELARIYIEEGQLGKALDLILTRINESDRFEPNTFNWVLDALARAGREADMGALARRFIATDARGAPRLQAVAVGRLIELGALEEAQALLDEAVGPGRASGLNALVVSLALIRGVSDAEAQVQRMLKGVGGALDLWERVLKEMHAATLTAPALRLVAEGVERFSGPRLATLQGKLLFESGQSDQAMRAWLDALARAPMPKDVVDVVEPILAGAAHYEQLAELHTRALALQPGRADATLALGRAYALAGQVDEATQVFQRVVSETDRAHGLIASAWADAGYLGRAIDAWAKLEPSLADDATAMLDKVALALAARGEAGRLDTFVRLYIQALRGNGTPPLLPIAEAYRRVGRADDAVRWLDRAERETPSADTALAQMRVRLDLGDRAGALAAAERVVVRRLVLTQPARTSGTLMAQALDPLATEMTEFGYPDLARDLALKIARGYGASTATRLVAARAMLVDNDLAGALRELAPAFEPWAQNRNLLPIFREVLEGLVARGYADAALAISERALDAGAERDVAIGAMRVALRAGDPAKALHIAARIEALQAGNGWLVGDLLMSERAPRSSIAPLMRGLDAKNNRLVQHAALDLALGAGARVAGLDEVLRGVPSVREDRVERSLIEGSIAAALPDADGPRRAAAAFLPQLRRLPLDSAVAVKAFVMASYVDDAALREAWRAVRRTNADENKLRRDLGQALVNAQRFDAALTIYDGLLESAGGDALLALSVFSAALMAGDDARAQRWADKALGRNLAEAPATLRELFAAEAARHRAHDIASELMVDDGGDGRKDTWRRALTRATMAFGRRDFGAFRAAVEQALILVPDEATARVDVAAQVLSARRGDAEWAAEALRVLEPLLREDLPPARALGLACAASADVATFRGYWKRRQAAFVGASTIAGLDAEVGYMGTLENALALGDGALLREVLDKFGPVVRREMLAALVQARFISGKGAYSAPVTRVLEREIGQAPPSEVAAVAIEIGLARLAQDVRGAVQAAAAAHARAPWSGALALARARVLLETKGDVALAARLVQDVMARPTELGLFDGEARFMGAPQLREAWETLALVQVARGERDAAKLSLARAQAIGGAAGAPRAMAMQRALVGASPRELAVCVAARVVPWSELCDRP